MGNKIKVISLGQLHEMINIKLIIKKKFY